MTIEAGQAIPQATFQIKNDEGVDAHQSGEYFAEGRTVLFALPGAFTRTCSAKHLPEYVEMLDQLKAAGVDRVACLSVNDAHVMKAWAEANGADGKIDMLADPHAEFARAGHRRTYGRYPWRACDTLRHDHRQWRADKDDDGRGWCL